MDQLQTRLDALEQRTHTVARQLRWWRGLAGALVVLGLLTWALPSGTAQEAQKKKDLEERVAALEDLLTHFSRKGTEVTITGANLHLVNGLGQTDCTDEQDQPIPDCPNGLGNLIVGYNEPRPSSIGETTRTGSHNVVVGQWHNFSRFGGLVVGDFNTISGDFASVSGGHGNFASGSFAAVSGGFFNSASGEAAVVSGGYSNSASGDSSVVSGGNVNAATATQAVVSGGQENRASGSLAVVSGGFGNTASGILAAVSGGAGNTASGELSVVSGGGNLPDEGFPTPGNVASGVLAVVSGGQLNTASGFVSTVSGGQNRTAAGEFDWVAGDLFEDD